VAPPIFGGAAITLGIGPHSSFYFFPISQSVTKLSIVNYDVSCRVVVCFLVRASDLRLTPPRGSVTVFGRINHLSISPSPPGQLSLLPSVGREMSTSQSDVRNVLWPGSKGRLHFGWTYRWQVRLRNPLLTRALPERLRDDRLIMISAIQIRLLLVVLLCIFVT